MAFIKIAFTGVVIFTSIWSFGGAQAALVPDSSDQTVYDTVKNVTWLANANLAATTTFGVSGINPDGSMSWNTAQGWITAMNTANYLGSSQWSLPATSLPDIGCSQLPKAAAFGYGCTGSQMGDLFYNDLGGQKGSTLE